jgi:hypothetical protein
MTAMSWIWNRWYGRTILILSVLWVAFVIGLDIRYDMTPRTTFGGLKILAAGWLGIALFCIACGLIRMITGRRS